MNFFGSEPKRRDLCRVAACLMLTAAVAAPACAEAQTTGSLPENHCSRLGEGFVAVAGSTACVRIGGHVRAGAQDGRTIDSDWARSGMRPIAEHRIRAGSGGTGLYPR